MTREDKYIACTIFWLVNLGGLLNFHATMNLSSSGDLPEPPSVEVTYLSRMIRESMAGEKSI